MKTLVDALCSPALSIELFAPKIRWNLEAQFTSLFVVSLFCGFGR